jgi:hypothetical protein
MWYQDDLPAGRPTAERAVPSGRVFAGIVGLEFAYLLAQSLAFLVQLEPNYRLWPVGVASAILWPLTFGWASYVLWHPKLAESRTEALLRSVPVWFVVILNVLLVAALLDRPEMVLRSPF